MLKKVTHFVFNAFHYFWGAFLNTLENYLVGQYINDMTLIWNFPFIFSLCCTLHPAKSQGEWVLFSSSTRKDKNREYKEKVGQLSNTISVTFTHPRGIWPDATKVAI